MSREFDYAYTCPDIDKAREEARDNIINWIDYRLEDYIHPKLYDELTELIRDELSDMANAYRDISGDMREAANDQIRELNEIVSDLKEELNKND